MKRLETGSATIIGLIVGIVVIAVLVIWYFSAGGIGGETGQLNKEMAQELEKTSGTSSTKIIDQTKGVAEAVSLPRDFPKDIPIFSPSRVLNVQMNLDANARANYTLRLEVDANQEQAREYYNTQLNLGDWRQTSKSSPYGSYIATDGDIEISVSIEGRSSDKSIVTIITPTKN